MKSKLGRVERNQLIAWMATNKESLEGKTSAQIIEMAKPITNGNPPSAAMISRTSRDLGIRLKSGKVRTDTAKNNLLSVKLRTLARIVLKLHNDLGQTPDETLLVLCGRTPVGNTWERVVQDEADGE